MFRMGNTALFYLLSHKTDIKLLLNILLGVHIVCLCLRTQGGEFPEGAADTDPESDAETVSVLLPGLQPKWPA